MMTERDEQAAALYAEYRKRHQTRWYASRSQEFREASDQIATAGAALFAVSSLLGVLAGQEWEAKTALAAIAAVIPALSVLLVAYAALHAYDRFAKSYDDAWRALADHGDDEILAAEEIMRVEQGQWGQLIAEIPPVELPSRQSPPSSSPTPPTAPPD